MPLASQTHLPILDTRASKTFVVKIFPVAPEMPEQSQTKQSNQPNFLSAYFSSIRLFLRKAVAPSKKEFIMLIKSHAVGIGFLGILGYMIKLIHIPINNIIVNKIDK